MPQVEKGEKDYQLSKGWATKKVSALANAYGVNLTEDAMDMWVEAVLDIVGINTEVEHTAFPGKKIRPGEWLFREWMATKDRFPKPVKLRRLYCRYWPPADGNEPIGLEEDE